MTPGASFCSSATSATAIKLRELTRAFRECVGRADAPVLIDQEGGRVQRMGPPHWRAYPAAAAIEAGLEPSRGRGRRASRRAPDRPRSGARSGSPSIARRCSTSPSRGPTPRSARAPSPSGPSGSRRWAGRSPRGCSPAASCPSSSTCRAMAGRASDSHHELPVVDAPRDELAARFRALRRAQRPADGDDARMSSTPPSTRSVRRPRRRSSFGRSCAAKSGSTA